MSKRKDVSGPTQLEFDCIWNSSGPKGGEGRHLMVDICTNRPANVVRFMDATTRSVRRDAVERVARSGIFALPSGKR